MDEFLDQQLSIMKDLLKKNNRIPLFLITDQIISGTPANNEFVKTSGLIQIIQFTKSSREEIVYILKEIVKEEERQLAKSN